MSLGGIVALLVGLVGLAAILVRTGMDRKSIDLSIEQRGQQAKHDAVNAVTKVVDAIDERKLDKAVFDAEKNSIERRLEVLERQAGLNGHGK